MSLYREAGAGKRRRRLLLAATAAVVAVAAVVTILVAGGDPSTADAEQQLQQSAEPALQALELVPLHYESTNEVTHAAAADQLAVARETVDGLEVDLRARNDAQTTALLAELDRLGALVRTTGRDADVERAATRAAAELRTLVGLPAGRG